MSSVRFALVGVLAALATSPLAHAQRSTPVQLTHSAPAVNDFFGSAMAMSGDTLVVTARADDVGAATDAGSAHVFRWVGSAWELEAILTPSTASPSANFGISVAISGDTIAIGADLDTGAGGFQGAVHIFVRGVSGTWFQQARLTAADGLDSDRFGVSVAIEGNTVLAGAFADTVGINTSQGSAYVFTRIGATWTQRAKLVSPDGAQNDNFGTSVALVGDDAIVGAPNDDVAASADQGSIHIFRRQPAGTWTHQQQLLSLDGAAGDRLAYCLSADASRGGTLAAGAYQDDVSAITNQGSAYVFARSPGGVWTQQAQLVAADGAVNDSFGLSISAHDDTVIVGSYQDDVNGNSNRGSAYVYTRTVSVNGAAWAQQSQLVAPDGASLDSLGSSVAVFGDRAAAGAILDDVSAIANPGSAWVFSRMGGSWIGQDFKLIAGDGEVNDQFGLEVAIDGNTLVIGNPSDDIGSNVNQGSAYVFVRSGIGGPWTQQAKLLGADGVSGDRFGSDVAISGDTIVVGADDDDVGPNEAQGSAYVFVRNGTTWTQQAQLTSPIGAAGDDFGRAVAIEVDVIAVGMPYDDFGSPAVNDVGRVVLYSRSGSVWTLRDNITSGAVSELQRFGIDIALNNNQLVVGTFDSNRSVYVYTGSSNWQSWSQTAVITPSDPAAAGGFGYSVGIDSGTVVVSANSASNGSASEGAAYIFVERNGVWEEQARLSPNESDMFVGFAVGLAIDGDTVAIGQNGHDIGGIPSVGSVNIYRRMSSEWSRVFQWTPTDGAFNDRFGIDVALDGESLVVGALPEGAQFGPGFAWQLDVPTESFPLATNDTLSLSYPSLDAAVVAASPGHTITATTGAFDSISALDTAGRTLYIRGSDRVRTPLGSTLTLGGGSSLSAPEGRPIEVHGQIRAAAGSSVDIYADHFVLGGSGILTVRAEAAMAVNAQRARLEGQARLERDASITFTGDADSLGGLTASTGASIACDGELRSSGLWSLVGGQVYTPHFTNCDTLQASSGLSLFGAFTNRGTARIIGESGIFGDLANDGGATLTIRAGTLFVFGSLTNNGSIVGEVCTSCLVEQPPRLEVGGSLSIGAAASLSMPSTGALVRTGGDFDCAIDSNARYDMALATLEVIGLPGERTLEAMSRDVGANETGLDRNLPGHYPVGMLRLGGGSIVTLVDAHDNDGLGQSVCEAIYVDELRIDSGARLVNASCRIYYNTLVNNGTIDVPANVIQIAPPCRADFDQNGVVAVPDIFAFLSAWFAGSPAADFDGNAFISVPDIFAFLSAWFAGCS